MKKIKFFIIALVFLSGFKPEEDLYMNIVEFDQNSIELNEDNVRFLKEVSMNINNVMEVEGSEFAIKLIARSTEEECYFDEFIGVKRAYVVRNILIKNSKIADKYDYYIIDYSGDGLSHYGIGEVQIKMVKKYE